MSPTTHDSQIQLNNQMMMYKPISFEEQLKICTQCPDWLLLAEACPRHADLLEFPSMIQHEELFTVEQIAELKEGEIVFHSFREQLLLNEDMSAFVMNLILYTSYFYEVLMVMTSVVAALLPVFLFIGVLLSKKPGFIRAMIVYLSSKLMFFFWKDTFSFKFSMQEFYLCTGPGMLVESEGLSEQCFLVSVFCTYLMLSTLMSMNNSLCRNILQRVNFSFYCMIFGACFLFALNLSKMHLNQNSQTTLITSIELGMGFAIVFLIMMVVFNAWPVRLSACFDSLPEEELLLNHLCMKWHIKLGLPKLEKMDRIKRKLEDVLAAKVEIDKKMQDLAKETQEDPLVYRRLIKDPKWDKMQELIDEMLNSDCKNSYMRIQ